MNDLSPTLWIALGITALYGLACLFGGIMGYLKAGSKASLITGVPSGIVLLACAAGTAWRPVAALSVAILVALLVGGFFTSNLLRHRNELRTWSGSRRSILMALGALLVLITAGIALATRT